jgi:hypothetical protein
MVPIFDHQGEAVNFSGINRTLTQRGHPAHDFERYGREAVGISERESRDLLLMAAPG